MSTQPPRDRFRALIRQPDEAMSLAEAALCIAWEDTGACDMAGVLRELDRIAEAARPLVDAADGPAGRVAALGGYLFGELGFRGNTWRYSEPHNSYLDHVLQARAGLPIALAAVYMEVGWRIGMPLAGLALPGHFLVQHLGEEPIYIDPFYRGRLWSAVECERQVSSYYGAITPELMHQVMAPPAKRAILERMLRNLKGAYLERQNLPLALAAVDRIMLLAPDDAPELRDRGLLLARMGRTAAALEDLERYARLAPTAPDLPALRQKARTLATSAAQN
jgi:regulator of sirC expression with transglutaminase-like and TPR domain